MHNELPPSRSDGRYTDAIPASVVRVAQLLGVPRRAVLGMRRECNTTKHKRGKNALPKYQAPQLLLKTKEGSH